MARKKNIINEELCVKAFEQLKEIQDSDLAIKLKAIMSLKDHTYEVISTIFQVKRITLNRWAKAFKEFGIDGLREKKKGHNKSKLSDEIKVELCKWVESSTNSEGNKENWTINKLRKEILKCYGISISYGPMWKTMRKLNMRIKRPRPRHKSASEELQAEFKKNSNRN
jgi:transposase